MTQRRWKLVVTELGSSDTLHDVVVEAGDWMTALGRARSAVGERGGVPPGASCAVSPEGVVTILDGVARRQYALTPTEEALPAPRAAASSATPAGAPKKVSKHTVAYMSSPFAPKGAAAPLSAAPAGLASGAVPAPAASAAPASVAPPVAVPRPVSVPAPAASSPRVEPAKPKHKHTVAYLRSPSAAPEPAAASLPVEPPAPAESAAPAVPEPAVPEPAVLEPAVPADAPAPEAPQASSPPTPDDGAELLYARDAERSAETPLTYRERTYLVPAGTSADDAEMIARRAFAAVREELDALPKGKLVNIAIFDHRWEGRPERAPLVTLQWKDWRGEADIQRPSASVPPASMPPASMPPASMPPASMPPASASSPPIAARRRLDTPGPDERLTQAFEALQDLFFLGSPLEGADFVLNLLNDLVPSEASSICIYDINTDELRFVALRGSGGEERRGEAIPLGLGLIGAAARDFTRPLLVEDVGGDARFDPGIDGRVGLDAMTMALVPCAYQGRLQALVQLVNRGGQAHFSKGDSNVLAYVGEKLGEFLHQSRLAAQERPSARR